MLAKAAQKTTKPPLQLTKACCLNNWKTYQAFWRKTMSALRKSTAWPTLPKTPLILKAAADLRNQISSYTAQLQNQQIEIENTERLYRMQKEVEQQQYHDMQACYTKYAAKGDYSACQK